MKIKIEIDTSKHDVDVIEITYDNSKENKIEEFVRGKEICNTLFDEYTKYFEEEDNE